MASSIFADRRSAVNVNGYLRLSQAAELVGVSIPTARLMLHRGEFGDNHHTTLGGHARVGAKGVYEWLGYDFEQEEDGTNSGVAAYSRVSSEKQSRVGSLARQQERLVREVATREGVDPSDIKMFSDVASAFGDRPGLNKLVESVLEGRVKVIYSEYMDRISRVPSLTKLITFLCEKYNVKIVYLDKEETDPSSMEAACQEAIAFFQILGNRMSAQKSLRVTFKHVSESTTKRIEELWSEGNNVKAIHKILRSEKHVVETESGKVSHVSYGKIHQILRSGGMVTNVSPNASAKADACEAYTHPFVEWCQAHLVVADEGSYDGKKDRIDCEDVYRAYGTWCKNTGRKLEPKTSVFQRFKVVIPDVKARRLYSMNRVFLLGCKLA